MSAEPQKLLVSSRRNAFLDMVGVGIIMDYWMGRECSVSLLSYQAKGGAQLQLVFVARMVVSSLRL
jgi:hypothetical protein